MDPPPRCVLMLSLLSKRHGIDQQKYRTPTRVTDRKRRADNMTTPSARRRRNPARQEFPSPERVRDTPCWTTLLFSRVAMCLSGRCRCGTIQRQVGQLSAICVRSSRPTTVREVAVIIPDGGSQEGFSRDLIVRYSDSSLRRISDCSPIYPPLHYVLLIPMVKLAGILKSHMQPTELWMQPLRRQIHCMHTSLFQWTFSMDSHGINYIVFMSIFGVVRIG
jgi:hypothetical protein